jgi:hypothetical protein
VSRLKCEAPAFVVPNLGRQILDIGRRRKQHTH